MFRFLILMELTFSGLFSIDPDTKISDYVVRLRLFDLFHQILQMTLLSLPCE